MKPSGCLSFPGDKACKQQGTKNSNMESAHIEIWGKTKQNKKQSKETGNEGRFREEEEKLKTAMSCVPVNEMFDEGSSGLSVKYCRGFCN